MNCRTHEHRQVERILHIVQQYDVHIFECLYLSIQLCAHPLAGVRTRSMVFCCLRWLAKHSRYSRFGCDDDHCTGARHDTRRENTSHASQPGLGADVDSLPCTCVVAVPRRSTSPTDRGSIDTTLCRPQIMCDYPLNLSILIRGGKETNKDSLSSCERKGKSSARRGGALARLPGSVYWKFCHLPCPAQCPSSTRMWLLLP